MSAQAVAGAVQRAIVRRFRQDMVIEAARKPPLAESLDQLDAMLAQVRQMAAEITPRDPGSRTRLGDEHVEA